MAVIFVQYLIIMTLLSHGYEFLFHTLSQNSDFLSHNFDFCHSQSKLPLKTFIFCGGNKIPYESEWL